MSSFERVGNCKIKEGKLTFGSLHVDENLKLPIAVISGSKGKTCFISGGIHGDEINGVRLVQLVMHSLNPKKLKGTIIFLPVLNVSGFHHKQRTVFEDGRDLNRCFPGKGRTVSYRIARAVFNEVIKKCDFGIDCHDSGERNVLLPHSRVHVNKKGVCTDGCTLDIGKLFGTKIILERKGEKGMMAIESFKRLKKPVLTFEVGGGLVLWENFLKKSLEGIKNVLIHNGFLDGRIKLPKEQFLIGDVNRFSYRGHTEGLLYKKIRLGQEIHSGDLVAVIHNAVNEKTEKVFAKHCGFVFSIKMQDKIDKAEAICSILQSNVCRAHATKPWRGFEKLK